MMQARPVHLRPAHHPGKYGGGAVAVVASGIAVAVAFGLPVTPEQSEALLAFVAVVGPLVAGWWGDHKSTPLAAPRGTDGMPLVPAAEQDLTHRHLRQVPPNEPTD